MRDERYPHLTVAWSPPIASLPAARRLPLRAISSGGASWPSARLVTYRPLCRPFSFKMLSVSPDLNLSRSLWDFPRFASNGGVHPDDWRRAAGAAALTRKLGISGLRELTLLLEREEARLGFRDRAADTPADVARELESARVCSELAKRELENEAPELNALALVAMVSALDALVEYIVPFHWDMEITALIREAEAQLAQQQPRPAPQFRRPRDELVCDIADALKENSKDEVVNHLKAGLPKFDRVRNVGVIRWERPLEHIGLSAGPGWVPDDLEEALTEIVVIRHLLVHRAGRIDRWALKTAPSLRQKDGEPPRVGELIRLTHADYLRYSPALWAYGEDIICRFHGDFDERIDLVHWRLMRPTIP